MLNGKGTFSSSIQVYTLMHTHILKDKYVSTQLNTFIGYTFQHPQTQAQHTHTLLKDTPSYTLTVITNMRVMERHMLVLHTHYY